ncbi:MAG: MATE family efflux transporter [Bacteroidales bacterium]|nr:MATE family efflux transporter [Bacteroidales bacterium]
MQLSDHFNTSRLLRFTWPSIAMMVFTSVYSLVDGYFVSNFVGKVPFAALNLIWPAIAVLSAAGFMFGSGGSALTAKTMGEGDMERANEYFSMNVEFTVILGLLSSLAGFMFIGPIARFLGANEAMLPYCCLYGRILLAGNVFAMLQNLFQPFFVTAGKPKYGLRVMVAAGITNIVMDALFIPVFGWGLAGAALATVAGWLVGGLTGLFYFLRIKNTSSLILRLARIEPRPVAQSASNGFSELMTQVCMSLVSMVYNAQLMKYAGENGVASYGMIMYFSFFFMAIFLGFSVGASPVIAYHYGARNKSEMRNLLHIGIRLNLIGGIAMVLMTFLIASPVSYLFLGYDQELFAMGRRGMYLFNLCYLIAGLNVFASAFFTALNNGPVSAQVAFSRSFFEAIAVILIPLMLSSEYIWLSSSVAEIAALIVAALYLVGLRKRYGY